MAKTETIKTGTIQQPTQGARGVDFAPGSGIPGYTYQWGGGGGSSSAAAQQARAQAQAEQARIQEVQRQEQIKQEQLKIAQQKAQAERLKIQQLAIQIRQVGREQSQALRQEIARRNANLRQNLIERGKIVGDKIVSGYDIVSGGSVTEKRILNRQQDLNKQVQDFNNQFSGELSESQYEKALALEKQLSSKQQQINNDYDKLAKSTRSKVVGTLFGKPFDKRVTIAEGQRFTESLVSKAQNDLNRLRSELATTNSKYKKAVYPRLIKATERELERYKAGGKPIVFAGELPITPFKALPRKISNVRFVGTQKKLQDGRTIINISYRTSTGRIGKAQAFVKPLGTKKSVGVVAGRSAVKFFKTPSKSTLRRVQTFVGKEVGLSNKGLLQLKKNMSPLVLTKNAKIVNQLSAGRVGSIKGQGGSKFWNYVGAKARKGLEVSPKRQNLDYEDFIALSKVLTRKDLSIIAGRSLSTQGSKANFYGLIRNLDKRGFRLDKGFMGGRSARGLQPREVSQAVNKLVNSMVGSIATAESLVKGANKVRKLGVAARGLKVISSNPKIFNSAVLRSPVAIKSKLMRKMAPSIMVMGATPLVRARTRTMTRTKVKVKQKTLVATKFKVATKQKARIDARVRYRIKAKQKAKIDARIRSRIKARARTMQPKLRLRNQIGLKRVGFRARGLRPGKGFVVGAFKLPRGFSSRRLSKSVKTYYVVEKVRGKYRKLYPKPLTAKDARDYATYSIDNRLSKTAFFIPLGKAKSVVRPPKNIQGYYSKNSRKFRPYRIRFGKRRQLVNGFIEKRKYFQDTRGERLQARNLRSRSSRPMNAARRKQLILQLQKARAVRMRQMGRSARPMRRSRPVRRVQRRINPAQRRELLRRLAKARRVRMMNLRRRR